MWEGISGLITLAVLVLKLWIDNKASIQKAKDDENKIIDNATTSDDLLREFNKLRIK